MPRKPNTEPNLRLIAARKAFGLTSCATCARALERHAHTKMSGHWHSFRCSEERYRSWEQGRIPREYAWPVLTSFFNMTANELGLNHDEPHTSTATASSVVGGPPRVAQEDDDVERRQFALGLPVALSVPAPPDRHRRVGMADVRKLRTSMSRLEALDDEVGGDNLHPIAGQYLAKSRQLLEGSYSPRVGQTLREVATELATDAGWFAYDAGQPDVAHTYLGQALSLARLSNSEWLEAQVYSLMSLMANANYRSREALHLAQAGQRAMTAAPLRLRALFDAREALAAARLGERTICRTALGRAWRRLDADAEEGPSWVRFFTSGELASLETICEIDLGALQHAATRLEAVITHSDGWERNRALRTAQLAEVRLALGDLDGAADAALAATCQPLGSTRVRTRIGSVAKRLARHPQHTGVSTFLGHWNALAEGAHHA